MLYRVFIGLAKTFMAAYDGSSLCSIYSKNVLTSSSGLDAIFFLCLTIKLVINFRE